MRLDLALSTTLLSAATRWPSSCHTLRVEENGVDADFPWRFDGRLWFRPALVRAPDPSSLPAGVSAVALLGWTIGGVVALEYDESPVGPYLEYVTMGSVVTKRGALGQWGSRLYVSSSPAEAICKEVWGVPAETADIEFVEPGLALRVDSSPPPSGAANAAQIKVGGWRTARSGGAVLRGGLPVLWTPQIKALWAPLVPLPEGASEAEPLALHRLRLSATSLRLQWCGQPPSDDLGTPLGIGLTVDGVRIEIGRKQPSGL